MTDQMTDGAAEPQRKRSVWSALAVFLERRTLVMLALGFAAGLPNLLVFDSAGQLTARFRGRWTAALAAEVAAAIPQPGTAP